MNPNPRLSYAPPFVLTLDIGSSSARALLFDSRGEQVAGLGANATYALRSESDGTSEADGDDLIEQAARCIDGLLAQAGGLPIGAVAVTTLASTILAVDGVGRPLMRLVTYADTRNDADAAGLRARLDERAAHERTGCPLRTAYWPARLAWFRRTQPEVWQQAARWLTVGEYLEQRLFGRSRVSHSAASWGGLLDRRTLEWDAPLLEALGLEQEQLSPPADVEDALAGLTGAYASRWPALRDVPWFPAIGDGAAANLGSGCTSEGRVALTVGTTGAMRIVRRDVAEVPAGLWCYRVDRRHALVGGATSEGGNAYAWVRRLARLGNEANTEAAVAAYPPDGHGLTILPFLAGERSPGWAGNVQATIHGLTLATTTVAILRAMLEAVAYRFAVIERRLSAGGEHRLIASGGALLNSPAWMQIFADVTGKLVIASAEVEATSRGAALLALQSLGLLGSFENAPAADGASYFPDAARHARYQEAIARQAWLYGRIIDSE